jgi:hypothetical protein
MNRKTTQPRSRGRPNGAPFAGKAKRPTHFMRNAHTDLSSTKSIGGLDDAR